MASSDNDNDFTADIVSLLRQAESLLSGNLSRLLFVFVQGQRSELAGWAKTPPIIFVQYVSLH